MRNKYINFYKQKGYLITNIFSPNDINILRNEIKKKISKIIKKKNLIYQNIIKLLMRRRIIK